MVVAVFGHADIRDGLGGYRGTGSGRSSRKRDGRESADGVRAAEEAIDSGAALDTLERFVRKTQELGT